jgi:hypothetical protein
MVSPEPQTRMNYLSRLRMLSRPTFGVLDPHGTAWTHPARLVRHVVAYIAIAAAIGACAVGALATALGHRIILSEPARFEWGQGLHRTTALLTVAVKDGRWYLGCEVAEYLFSDEFQIPPWRSGERAITGRAYDRTAWRRPSTTEIGALGFLYRQTRVAGSNKMEPNAWTAASTTTEVAVPGWMLASVGLVLAALAARQWWWGRTFRPVGFPVSTKPTRKGDRKTGHDSFPPYELP